MAGRQFVLGAVVIVTALTRSVRYVVRLDANGTGDPSHTMIIEIAPMYRQNS